MATARPGPADGRAGITNEASGVSDDQSPETTVKIEEGKTSCLNVLVEELSRDKHDVSLPVDVDKIPITWVRKACMAAIATRFDGYDQCVLPNRMFGLIEKIADLINQAAKKDPTVSLPGWHQAINVANKKLRDVAKKQMGLAEESIPASMSQG